MTPLRHGSHFVGPKNRAAREKDGSHLIIDGFFIRKRCLQFRKSIPHRRWVSSALGDLISAGLVLKPLHSLSFFLVLLSLIDFVRMFMGYSEEPRFSLLKKSRFVDAFCVFIDGTVDFTLCICIDLWRMMKPRVLLVRKRTFSCQEFLFCSLSLFDFSSSYDPFTLGSFVFVRLCPQVSVPLEWFMPLDLDV